MSNLLKIDDDYKNWILDISKRFKASQIKAAVKVNSEMLQLYWSIGKDLERIKGNYNWRTHFYSQVSKDIQAQLPDMESFSQRNLLYMHQFYRLYFGGSVCAPS